MKGCRWRRKLVLTCWSLCCNKVPHAWVSWKLSHGLGGGEKVRHCGGWWKAGKASRWPYRYRITAVFCVAESFKSVATSCHLLSGMKLLYWCIPPHHSCVLLCMATLFVWYNGKVLHTWHYNWLVTHAGVCFLNNNPPPARALRNVITINLNGADQSWSGPTPSPMLSPTQWHTDVQHPVWMMLFDRSRAWVKSSLISDHHQCVHLVLDPFMSGWIRCEDLGGDSWWQSFDSTWLNKRRQYLKY